MRTLFAVPTTLSCVHIYILIRKPAGSHGVQYREVPLYCNVKVYVHTTYLFEGKSVGSSMVFPRPLVWLAVYYSIIGMSYNDKQPSDMIQFYVKVDC